MDDLVSALLLGSEKVGLGWEVRLAPRAMQCDVMCESQESFWWLGAVPGAEMVPRCGRDAFYPGEFTNKGRMWWKSERGRMSKMEKGRKGEREKGREEGRKGERKGEKEGARDRTTGAEGRWGSRIRVSSPGCHITSERDVKELGALRGPVGLGVKAAVCFHVHTGQTVPERSVI